MFEHLGQPSILLSDEDKAVITHFSKDAKCLELGTYCGDSAKFIADSGAKSVLTIDSYSSPRIPFDAVRENIKLFADKITLVNNTTANYSIKVQNNFYDMLFIDASHCYEDVLIDFALYHPKVVNGGIILFHDCNEVHPCVVKAVNYVKTHFENVVTEIDLTEFNSNIMGFKVCR